MAVKIPGAVPIEAITSKRVVTLTPDTSLKEASRNLAEHNFDRVPVVDEET